MQSKTIAEQMAEKINAKLGYTPHADDDKDLNGEQETFKRFEEELDINDFPQTARWKVTSKVSGKQGSLRLEKNLNLEGFLEKSLKI